MTGIERMMASRGLNNSYTHSKRANNPAIPIAQTNEIDMPKTPLSIVAPTDRNYRRRAIRKVSVRVGEVKVSAPVGWL